MYVRIDRRRKLPVTTLLMALDGKETAKLRQERAAESKSLQPYGAQGMAKEEILAYFFHHTVFHHGKKGWTAPFNPDAYRGGVKLMADLVDAKTGKVRAEAGSKLAPRGARKLHDDGLREIEVTKEELVGRYLAIDLVNEETGEVIAEAGDEITDALLIQLEESKAKELPVLAIDNVAVGPYIRNTLAIDKNATREDALIDIYRVMRPGEPPTLETAESLFNGLFFDQERVLRKDDILAILKVLTELKDGRGEIDDIDHLGNRRVPSVGELMENQYRIGLLRMERAIRERMSSVEIDTVMPHDLINAKPAAAAVREFFGSSQLSQFMDQTNPLSEITHKRRLSALGPGGL